MGSKASFIKSYTMLLPSFLQEYPNSLSDERTYSTQSSIQKKNKTFCKN